MKSTKLPGASAIPASRATITVASKIDMDIEIRLCKPKEARVTGQFGSTVETINVPYGESYVIRGTSYPVGTVPKGFRKQPELAEDYALTHGIPADWFKEWLEQNAETDMVKNRMIFAAADSSEVESIGSDFRKLTSGLGPMVPDTDPRNPKPLLSHVQPVKTDEERSSARHAA